MSALIVSKDSYLVFKRLEMPEIQSQKVAIEMIKAELTNGSSSESLLNLPHDIFSNSKDIYGIFQKAQHVGVFSEKIWVTGILPHFQVIMIGTPSAINADFFLNIAELSTSQLVKAPPAYADPIAFELISTAEYTQTCVLRSLEKSRLPLGTRDHLQLSGLGKMIDNPLKIELAEQIREKLRCGFPSRSSFPKNALEMPSEWYDIHVRIWKTRLTVALYEWALERSRSFASSQADVALKPEKVQCFVDNVMNPSISIVLDMINTQTGLLTHFPLCEDEYVFFFLLLLSTASESDALKLTMLSQIKSNKIDADSICNYYQEQRRGVVSLPRVEAVRQYFSTFQNKSTWKNQVDSFESYKKAIWSIFDNVMSKNWLQLPQRTPDLYEQCIKKDIIQIVRDLLYATLDLNKTLGTIINHFVPDEKSANDACKLALFPLASLLGSFPPIYAKKLYDEAVKEIVMRWALLNDTERAMVYPNQANRDNATVLLSQLQASVGFDNRTTIPPPPWLNTILNNYLITMKVRFFDEWTKNNNVGKIASLTQNAYLSFRYNPANQNSLHVFPLRTLDTNDNIGNMYIQLNKLQEKVSFDSVISVSSSQQKAKTLDLKISNLDSFKRKVPKDAQLTVRVEWLSHWQNDAKKMPTKTTQNFDYKVAASAPNELNASFTIIPNAGSGSVQAIASVLGEWNGKNVEIAKEVSPVASLIFY